jgi:hypothetical protein
MHAVVFNVTIEGDPDEAAAYREQGPPARSGRHHRQRRGRRGRRQRVARGASQRCQDAGVGATSIGSPPGCQWASGDGGVSRRYHSASSAPMQPVPAAVTACR